MIDEIKSINVKIKESYTVLIHHIYSLGKTTYPENYKKKKNKKKI